METIQVKDKLFTPFIKEQEIQKEIKRVASEINRDYQGKEPLFLCILNGSFMFAADLLKNVTVPCNVSFVKVASYQGTETTGKVKELMGLQESVEGRDVIIIEDIVDTGYTMRDVLESLSEKNAASVAVCALLCKPDKLKVDINLKYLAMNIPNGFIVGYGAIIRGHCQIYIIIDISKLESQVLIGYKETNSRHSCIAILINNVGMINLRIFATGIWIKFRIHKNIRSIRRIIDRLTIDIVIFIYHIIFILGSHIDNVVIYVDISTYDMGRLSI